LGGSLRKFRGIAQLALGGAGLLGGVQMARASFTGLVADLTATERLMSTINRRGGDMVRAQAVIRAAVGRTSLGGTEISGALEKMIQLTGDFAGSTRNLGLVLSMAAAGNKSLEETSRAVAFAMQGELRIVGRLSTGVRALIRDYPHLQGTAEGAARAIAILTEEAGKAAEEFGETKQGQLDRFTRGIRDLSEGLFKGATNGLAFASALAKIGDQLTRISTEPAIGTLGKILLMGGIPGGFQIRNQISQEELKAMEQKPGLLQRLLPGVFPHQTPINRDLEAQVQAKLLANLDAQRAGLLSAQPGGMLPLPGSDPRGLATLASWQAQSMSGLGVAARGSRAGGIRGDVRDPMDVIADQFAQRPRSENKWATAMIEQMKDRRQLIASTVGDIVAEGFLAGAQGGAQGMADFLKREGMSIIGSVLSAIVTTAMGGTAGGLGGAILEGIGLSRGGSSSNSASVDMGGIQLAQRRSAQWRTVRLG
jgi:hypothetical protein